MTMRNDTVYLRHILDAIKQIEEYLGHLDYEGFSTSRLVQDGVIRQFEIIGEASKTSLKRCVIMHPKSLGKVWRG